MAEKEVKAGTESKEPEEAKKETKKKKINKLSLAVVEERLKKTEESMGGLTSKYARKLLKRKEELS